MAVKVARCAARLCLPPPAPHNRQGTNFRFFFARTGTYLAASNNNENVARRRYRARGSCALLCGMAMALQEAGWGSI